MHPVCDFLEELSTRVCNPEEGMTWPWVFSFPHFLSISVQGRVPQPEEGLIFAEIDDKHVAGNPIGVRSDISCPGR